MKKAWILIILALVCAFPFSVNAEEEAVKWDGFSFDLDNLDGDGMDEGDVFVDGQLYLVDFWASWCRPCSQYLPHLAQMVEDYGDRGFSVTIFCVDAAATVSTAKSQIAGENYPFTILLDTESDVKNELGVKNIPTTILFNSSGEELWRHAGYSAGVEDEVREHIEMNLPEAEAE